MAINSDYVQQMATQLASYEIQAAQSSATRRENSYNAQVKALSSLKSALTTFSSAVSGLKSGNNSMVVNTAKFSSEGFATATVGSKASTGSYEFTVEKLASKSQTALAGLDPSKLGSGTLDISQDGSTFSVDLSSITSVEALASAINKASGNEGVQATLVRSGETVNLVLTSAETGAKQAVSYSFNSADGDFSALQERKLSEASDAKVWLGGKGSGIELVNASNTFENVIDGVSLTFSKVHGPDDAPLTLDIAQDSAATKGKVDTFVSAYNTLMSSLSSMTASGANGSSRGALAGDSSVAAIKSMINQTLRGTFAGTNLINFGVRATSSGTLSIDTATFDKALANNPEGLDSLFTGKGNLVDSLTDALKVYTNATNGVLTNRVATLNERLSDIGQEFDKIQAKYDSSYQRYLKQYTNLMQVMSSMEQTGGLF